MRFNAEIFRNANFSEKYKKLSWADKRFARRIKFPRVQIRYLVSSNQRDWINNNYLRMEQELEMIRNSSEGRNEMYYDYVKLRDKKRDGKLDRTEEKVKYDMLRDIVMTRGSVRLPWTLRLGIGGFREKDYSISLRP